MKILANNIEDNGNKEVDSKTDNIIVINEEINTDKNVIEAEFYRSFFEKYYD